MGQVEGVGVDLDLGQLVEVHHLLVEASKVEFAGALLNYAPVFELDGGFDHRLFHNGRVLDRFAVLSPVLLLDSGKDQRYAASEHRYRETGAAV